MKILIYVENFLEKTCTFIYNEIEELAKYNEVKVLYRFKIEDTTIPNVKTEMIQFDQAGFVQSIDFRLQKLGFAGNFKNKAFADLLKHHINSFKPDVIHSHFGTDSQKIADNLEGISVPLFISFHGYDASMELEKKSYCNKLNHILGQPNVFPIFVSYYMKQYVEQKIGQAIDKYQILYYGTNTENFTRKNYNPPKTPLLFLQVSSFRLKKGHIYTIEAFKQFLDQNPDLPAKLVLAGSGPTLKTAEALVEKLGLKEKVEFPGFMSIEETKEWMERAHIFCHHSIKPDETSDMEGIPNAIMEAMAMELPILSTIHSGIPELVVEGVHGFLVPERDVNAYADRMKQIYTWKHKKENRARVTALFEKKNHRKILEDAYRKITRRFFKAVEI